MRIELIDKIKKVLSENEKVIFAYLFGSFMKSEIYNDIDIAVYCNEPLENPFEVTSDLKMALSEATGLYPDFFDITLINYSLKSDRADSLLILYEIFNGFLLLDRNPHLRTSLIEKTSLQLREIEGILKEVFA
ncbi:nucleotidyltransferase domain-containing protein [Thermodesulfovibrio sp. TK110]